MANCIVFKRGNWKNAPESIKDKEVKVFMEGNDVYFIPLNTILENEMKIVKSEYDVMVREAYCNLFEK